MGLSCISIKIGKCMKIDFLIGLLDHLRFIFMVALTSLGLLNPPQQAAHTEDHFTACVLVMDGLYPSLIPVQSVMASIKKRLPVIEYRTFVERYNLGEDHVDTVCSVCLNCVERSHEIRELLNCSHVFHRECLDRWVDESQVTCPLCRTMMLPPRQRVQAVDQIQV
ncbi:putative RING finger protein P4H10.07 [Morella rubra]|uniref:Putative RING finger protein P4H10.07 n=2 Tax=Morella rubra TaxID=262757 RepID=A0A6A1VVR6_9ROSI|nr:putative RING finger protein P4H10.07 [Morella rubra]